MNSSFACLTNLTLWSNEECFFPIFKEKNRYHLNILRDEISLFYFNKTTYVWRNSFDDIVLWELTMTKKHFRWDLYKWEVNSNSRYIRNHQVLVIVFRSCYRIRYIYMLINFISVSFLFITEKHIRWRYCLLNYSTEVSLSIRGMRTSQMILLAHYGTKYWNLKVSNESMKV